MDRCEQRWPEWKLHCDLEIGHDGPHVGTNVDTGKSGYWGGRIAYVGRIDRTELHG